MPEGSSKPMILDAASAADSPSPWRTGMIMAGVAAGGLVLAGAVALWVHYGTAVFFEMVRAGFAACFG